MLKIENAEVVGWKAAIRGMRNPMNSWDRSDTIIVDVPDTPRLDYYGNAVEIVPAHKQVARLYEDDNRIRIGGNDISLMTTLRDAGTDHRKFMRMIAVYVDLTGPLYWWKEFDTYKVATVANSCSTMHKIADKEFTLDDFSCEHLIVQAKDRLKELVRTLNNYRDIYVNWDREEESIQRAFDYEKKRVWWQMIQLLPSSYNQKRTIMLNYEVLANIYKSRRNHKLDEWHTFCDWIEKLPYSELITGKETLSDVERNK